MLPEQKIFAGVVGVMRQQHLRWSYLSTLATGGLQLLSALTLTRFLQPKDYGLAALALLSTNMMAYFTQLGVGRALVQKPHITEANIRAAFTLSLLSGLLGVTLLSLSAPLIGRMLHDTRQTVLVRVFSLNLMFQAAALVSGGLLRRALRMRTLALCDAAAYGLSTFGVGLPLAVSGYGVWALMASTVSQSLIQCICYFISQPHSLRLLFAISGYRGIAPFSGKTTITTAIEACGSAVDVALIGRLLGPAAVGVYGRSLTLSTQPCFQLSMGLTRVFAPALAETVRTSDRSAVVASVTHAQRQLLSVILPMCVAAAIWAPFVVPVVLGRQWLSAVPVYQVLCIVAALDSSFDIPALQLEIANRFRAKVWLQSVFALTFAASILVVAPRAGLLGVASVYAVLQAGRSLYFHHLSSKSLGVPLGTLVESWYAAILCSVCVGAIAITMQQVLPEQTVAERAMKAPILVCSALFTACTVYYVYKRDTVFRNWKNLFLGVEPHLQSACLVQDVALTQEGSTCA